MRSNLRIVALILLTLLGVIVWLLAGKSKVDDLDKDPAYRPPRGIVSPHP